MRIADCHIDQIAVLARRYGVARLELFGSATTANFDPATSDVDILVVFASDSPDGKFAAYFGLRDDLATLLGRPVDLVTQSSIRNPYFLRSVNETRRLLYAA